MSMSKENSTFYLQAGFVEGIVENEKTFSTIEEAYVSILKNTKEYCIIEWNSIPFSLDYKKDIPYLIKPICELLEDIIFKINASNAIKFESPNTVFFFNISEILDDQIKVNAHFKKVKGKHQEVLNLIPIITIDKNIFIAEWKLLIEQILKALQDSKNNISIDKELDFIKRLHKINDHISDRASRYQYTKRIN